MFEEYGHAQTMRHSVIENPGHFGPMSFLPGCFSLGLLHTSQQWQHLHFLTDIVLQKVTPDRMLYQCAGVCSFRPIIGVGCCVLGRSFRPRDVSDSL